MKQFELSIGGSSVRWKPLLLASVLLLFLLAAGWWLVDGGIPGATDPAGTGRDHSEAGKPRGGEVAASGRHPSSQSFAGTRRQALQIRAQGEEAGALFTVLASEEHPVDERVRRLRAMRGAEFSRDECGAAMAFLAGEGWPEGLSKGSAHWLADELLTALRLQDPTWDGLAAALGEVAFLPETDPVIRDYIMQHLGHLWEQYGEREEIENALWRAVGTADETTPGSALIALSRGYERDQQEKSLAQVRQRAFELAQNPETGLAVRVTALSIAGDGDGNEVQELAKILVMHPDTPVILRKVAERVGR